MKTLTENATNHPGRYMWATALVSLIMLILVGAPTLAPGVFSPLQPLKIDTDPENMLAADEPVRVFHNDMKAAFSLYDVVVVGIVEPEHSAGVFNVRTLSEIHELTQFATTLNWEIDGKPEGVVGVDVIAPGTVDNIEQGGLGSVRFDWLMDQPPTSEAEAQAIAEKAKRIPLLDDTLVSQDGRAIALYLPITRKDVSYRVSKALKNKISEFDGKAQYHITGLTVAQDQFGVEMFKQMAISAPLAMLVIFGLLWYFFRQLNLIVSPMLVAMVSVIGAMGLLVLTGNTVHIMSSMIPIFVMPIAVLDAVHILSDFYDKYPEIRDRRKTLDHVMEELWRPMFFTTLTTCAGFLSLAFTPIPPVQVFGLFVAIGVFFAWFLTVTFIPAYIMLMSEEAFTSFGFSQTKSESEAPFISRFLQRIGKVSSGRSKLVLVFFSGLIAIAIYGIGQIRINDNPVKWFEPDHEIRIADKALNERFGGTYMAYLTLSPAKAVTSPSEEAEALKTALAEFGPEGVRLVDDINAGAPSKLVLIQTLQEQASRLQDEAETDEAWDNLDAIITYLDERLQRDEVFKSPETLRYVERLQAHLLETGLVGKSNGLTDVVKTVHRDLLLGEEKEFRIPDTSAAVAQTLLTYQNSHRPQDLWHFVTPDYRRANLWVQLKSGDNIDMQAVTHAVDQFMADHPAPEALKAEWFGLTYINVVWQEKMVSGMLNAFLGSFFIVLIMMSVLFRSVFWGFLAMIPLTVTIVVIYGVIGLIGKDYDMPVAVLSALSLGLAVDYAIHFNARARQIHERLGNWKDTVVEAFGEPARAILRNVIVIGVGFLPLLAAPLVPYQTVGIFISAILFLAGVTTLVVLPSLITLGQKILFKVNEGS